MSCPVYWDDVYLLNDALFEKGDDSSTDVELPWTPALSDYESATEENDSMQHLEFSEYHLHTNSPAWAALFPLPDSPEIITAALPAKDPDVRIFGFTGAALD